MSAVMGWLVRARTHPRAPQETPTLAHPQSTLIIGLVSAGFFSVLAVWSALFPGKTGSPLISLFFLAFAALGVPLILDYRNARHVLTPDGLRFWQALGRRWPGPLGGCPADPILTVREVVSNGPGRWAGHPNLGDAARAS
jgi:hypothetical protein